MRKRFVRFLQYCLRVDCVMKLKNDSRTVNEIVDRYNEAMGFLNDLERHEKPEVDYWQGYVDGIKWVLRVK